MASLSIRGELARAKCHHAHSSLPDQPHMSIAVCLENRDRFRELFEGEGSPAPGQVLGWSRPRPVRG